MELEDGRSLDVVAGDDPYFCALNAKAKEFDREKFEQGNLKGFIFRGYNNLFSEFLIVTDQSNGKSFLGMDDGSEIKNLMTAGELDGRTEKGF